MTTDALENQPSIDPTQPEQALSRTRSVCPECLRSLPAWRVRRAEDVLLVRDCPEHGRFETPVWRGTPAFESWSRPKTPSRPAAPVTDVARGCPNDCGLCPGHGQRSCSVLLEVTGRCDLRCAICFADAGAASADPPLERVRQWYARTLELSGPCNIQLSGGEPTMRDDLPEIVALGKAEGFSFIQVNTNGLRLARDPAFAERLAEAGLSSVFLQFDSCRNEVHHRLRGAALLEAKLAAAERCAALGLGVVLVPTLVPGLNDDEVGDLLRLGMSLAPGVRGVHFQPVSWFGRHEAWPGASGDRPRLTLPELMRLIEAQTGGLMRADDFSPPGCEHALCSCHAAYLLDDQGRPILQGDGGCGCADPLPAEEGARRSVSFIARQWAAPAPARPALDDFDRFLERSRRVFAVSAMAFQDAWTLDLERLNGCCIHCLSPDGRLIPFCAYNLTAADGRALHRGRTAPPSGPANR